MISVYLAVLGAGWSPAVLETFQEIDLIRAAQRLNHRLDLNDYYIGGTVDLSNESDFPEHVNATPSGNYRQIWLISNPKRNNHFQMIY